MRGARAEWLFGGAFVALLLVAVNILPVPQSAGQGDSFAEDAGGKRAYFLLCSGLLSDVRRSADALLPDDEDAKVLMMLGPARYPDRAQWQTLHDWVSQGHALVFAARWEDPAVSLEPFGIEVVPFSSAEPADPDPDEPEPESESEPMPRIATILDYTEDIDWRSAGHVRGSSAEATVLLSWDGMPQIVWQQVGDGILVVASSDFIFTNRSLTLERNGLLAFRVLETAAPEGPVYFDESLNEAGAPKVVGILLEPPFRLQTLQLLLVVTLYMWAASRRFGPVLTEEQAARRSLVEHAEALGSLHFRVGTAAALLSSYLEFFRKELGLSRRGGAALEASASTESASVMRALRAAKNPGLDRATLAALIRALARARAENRRSS